MRLVYVHLQYLVRRVLESYLTTHALPFDHTPDPTPAQVQRAKRVRTGVATLLRTHERIRYWLFDYEQMRSEWDGAAQVNGVESTVSATECPPERRVSVYVWLLALLAARPQPQSQPQPQQMKTRGFPAEVSHFVIHWFRARLQEDLCVYVDRKGRSLANGAWVFWASEVWQITGSPPTSQTFQLRRGGSDKITVTIPEMAAGGLKLTDCAFDQLQEEERRLAEDVVYREEFYDNDLKMRTEAVRRYLIDTVPVGSAVGAAVRPPHPVTPHPADEVDTQVSARVDLVKAKRAARSNLLGFSAGKRSRFSAFKAR